MRYFARSIASGIGVVYLLQWSGVTSTIVKLVVVCGFLFLTDARKPA